MQIPLISGIYTDNSPDLRTSYPVNMIPVPKQSGISEGFIRPADGIIEYATGLGKDRGGIEWNGTLYRVMGTKLVSVSSDGVITELGDVGGDDSQYVTFDYSFDRLAVASSGNLYYWNGTTLTSVADPDLGNVVDFAWVDGYFMTTDGTSLVVTELNDPTSVNPLKYGSSEIDPDPVKAIIKLRNEMYVLNRHTIEVFDNVGGDLFPFQRIDGAQVQKGVIGTHACCVFSDLIAFLGSGRNEPPSVYVASNGDTKKIGTQEIDYILQGYTEDQLSTVKLEARNHRSHRFLYIHLPDRTLVYDIAASSDTQSPIWFVLTSAIDGFSKYRARNFVWCYDKWIVGDTNSNKLGYLDDNTSHHFGDIVRWEFGSSILYNEGNGAIFNQIELVALTGRVEIGKDPKISTSYSIDGQTWSQDKSISIGTIGNRNKRLVWFRQGHMRNWRVQRFKGDSQAHMSFVRIEAKLTPLVY